MYLSVTNVILSTLLTLAVKVEGEFLTNYKKEKVMTGFQVILLIFLGLMVFITIILVLIKMSAKELNKQTYTILDSIQASIEDSTKGGKPGSIYSKIDEDYGGKYPISKTHKVDWNGLLLLDQFLTNLHSEFGKVEMVYTTNYYRDLEELKGLVPELEHNNFSSTIFKVEKNNYPIYFFATFEKLVPESIQWRYEVPDEVLGIYTNEKGEIRIASKIVYFGNKHTSFKARSIERYASRTFKRKDMKLEEDFYTWHWTLSTDRQMGTKVNPSNVGVIEESREMSLDDLYEKFKLHTGAEDFEVPASLFLEHYLDMTLQDRSIENCLNIHIKGDAGVGKTRFIEHLRCKIDERDHDAHIITANATEFAVMLRYRENLSRVYSELNSFNRNAPIYLIIDEGDKFYNTDHKTTEQSMFLELLDGSLAREFPMHIIMISNLTEEKLPPYFERAGRIDFTVTIPPTSLGKIQHIVNDAKKEGREINYRFLSELQKKGNPVPLSLVFNGILVPWAVTQMKMRTRKIQEDLKKLQDKATEPKGEKEEDKKEEEVKKESSAPPERKGPIKRVKKIPNRRRQR